MTISYRPYLDVTPVLSPIDASYYISLIGVIQWIVKLGPVDICLELSMMSSYMPIPREGHLSELFHIFAQLPQR